MKLIVCKVIIKPTLCDAIIKFILCKVILKPSICEAVIKPNLRKNTTRLGYVRPQ
jgi:hypothetical protein